MSNEIGKKFIEMTKFSHLGKTEQMNGKPQPPIEMTWDRTLKPIDLPAPKSIEVPELNLQTAIEKRESVRKYNEKPVSLEELSFVLWCTMGVREVIEGSLTFRNVPSAGARHSLETFLLINRVRGLKPGLYRYLAVEHKLIEINHKSEIANEITEACIEQTFIKSSAVTFIWAADIERMKWRYGERGYRYVLLDAGHVCQNLYLSAEEIDCGVCAIASFYDDALNGILGLDGENNFAVYLGTMGKIR